MGIVGLYCGAYWLTWWDVELNGGECRFALWGLSGCIVGECLVTWWGIGLHGEVLVTW